MELNKVINGTRWTTDGHGRQFYRSLSKKFRSVNGPKILLILVTFAWFDPFVVHVRIQKSSQKKDKVEQDGHQKKIF